MQEVNPSRQTSGIKRLIPVPLYADYSIIRGLKLYTFE